MRGMSSVDRHRLGVMRALLARIEYINASIGHSLSQGQANEQALRDLLVSALPDRYGIGTGVIIGTDGVASRQVDVVVYDRSRSNFGLAADAGLFLADQVVAAIEVKTTFTSGSNSALASAVQNVASVKKLQVCDRPWRTVSVDPDTGQSMIVEHRSQPPLGLVLFFAARDQAGPLDLDAHFEAVKAAVSAVSLEHQPDLLMSVGHAAIFRHADLAHTEAGKQQAAFLVRAADGDGLSGDSPEGVTSAWLVNNAGKTSHIAVTGGPQLSLDPLVYPVATVRGRQYLLDRARALLNFLDVQERLLDLRSMSPVWQPSDYFGANYASMAVYPGDFPLTSGAAE